MEVTAHILAICSKKQNRVLANIQEVETLNVEQTKKCIMIKHNGHEVLALPYILESIVETIINWTVKRKKNKTKI